MSTLPGEGRPVGPGYPTADDGGADRSEPAVTRALYRQNQSLRQTLAVVDHLTAVALDGADVVGVTEELAAAIDSEVAVFDLMLRPLAASGARDGSGSAMLGADPFSLEDPRLAEVIETVRDSRLPIRFPAFPDSSVAADVVVAPIAIGDSILGYLVVTTGRHPRDDEDLELITVQHAASIYALALVQAQRDAELRARYRAELVESLLVGRAEEPQAAELARLAGLRGDIGYLVVAIALLDPVNEALAEASPILLEALAAELDGLADGVVAVARVDQVTVLVPAAAGEPAFSTRVTELLARRFATTRFVLGASRVAAGPGELGRADVEARRALAVARRLGVTGEVTSHDSLGVHRLLLHVPPEELSAFAQDVLGELLGYDARQNATLVDTLGAYLRQNANLRRTAEELYVHVNTVSYRLHRIEMITGLSLSSAADRLLAEIAIESLRVLPALG